MLLYLGDLPYLLYQCECDLRTYPTNPFDRRWLEARAYSIVREHRAEGDPLCHELAAIGLAFPYKKLAKTVEHGQ